MSTVLAAIDNSAAARPVVAIARWLAEQLEAEVAAVHVGGGATDTSTLALTADGLTIDLREGDIVDSLVAAFAEPDVIVGVVGARGTPGGPRPAGHTALAMARRAAKALVVVPPDYVLDPDQRARRVLVPMDGVKAHTDAVREVTRALHRAGLEIVGLHVFDTTTVPRFLDRANYELPILSDEMAAQLGEGSRVELRAGAPAQRVLQVAEDEDVDLIAMSWDRELSPGHAETVRDVLAAAAIPVLLLPTARIGGPAEPLPALSEGA
jgi:nucleotide-binding universal stress UspA family protein